MPGLYTITTRINGEVLTADNYNADHQSHVDHLEPSYIDDQSASVGAFQTVVDPGEVGSESLPTTLEGENQRDRFCIKEMKGTTQWYTSTIAKEIQGDVVAVGHDANLAWPDTTTSSFLFSLRIPWDYASGDIVFHLFRRVLAGSGTAIMPYTLTRSRNGAAIHSIGAGNINYAPGNTNSNDITLSIGAADFALGDFLRVAVSRLGADGGDTNAGAIAYDGHYFVYTGYAGRR